jgi:hypothetical protein
MPLFAALNRGLGGFFCFFPEEQVMKPQIKRPRAKRSKSSRLGVRITPEQETKLERLASNLGVNVSGLLRILIDDAKVEEATDHA